MKKETIIINEKAIGADHPPYIIAEISANHNGSVEHALQLIEAAKTAGADAVKLQTYTADTMTINMSSDEFCIKGGLWDGYRLYDLYHEAHTPWEWHKNLFAKAKDLDITIFSTPFDNSSVDFLESLDVPAYKIASFEIVDLPLINKVASTGKPLIISTGMANLKEIEAAMNEAHKSGCKELILLHCVSGYPTPPEDINLNTITDMRKHFGVPIGLSDHTLGTVVPVAATALGAVLIEKHFTFSRNDGGHDSAFSLEPQELKRLCEDTKTAWLSLGTVNYERKQSEKENLIFRRSLYVTDDIRQGELLSPSNIRSIRPGYGMEPKYLPEVIGKKAIANIKKGTPLTWEMLG